MTEKNVALSTSLILENTSEVIKVMLVLNNQVDECCLNGHYDDDHSQCGGLSSSHVFLLSLLDIYMISHSTI